MNRVVSAALVAVGVVAASPLSLGAQPATLRPPSAASPPRVAACALVPKEEVKRHLPWMAALDRMAIEEEPVGPSGSACTYPSVHIQVLPYSQRVIDLARERGGLEAVAGVGDAAYFHNNANRYAELYVRVGRHLLTLQADVNGAVESVKPGVVSLAKALVAKLR